MTNWAGIAAGYAGYSAEERRLAEEARQKKADQRADETAQFAQEQRGWARADRAEVDRVKANDKADIAAVNAEFDQRTSDQSVSDGQAEAASARDQVQQDQMQAAINQANAVPQTGLLSSGVTERVYKAPTAASPAATSAPTGSPVLPAAVADKVQQLRASGGVPAPRNFNDVLERQIAVLQRKSARGDIAPKEYAQELAFINNAKNEGVHDALAAFSSGDYEGGLAAFNRVGQNKGARVVKGEEGTTTINGEEVPTHFVTIANADGSRTTMDTAKAQFQLLDMNARLNHLGRARQTDMQRQQHADQISVARDQLKQSAADSQAGREIQRASLRLQQQQVDQATPIGQLTAMSKALGRPLTTDEIENRLGMSKIPRAVELQVQSLLREADTDSAAVARAAASPEGINPVASATFQKNAAIRQARLSQLLGPYSGAGRSADGQTADPLNLNGADRGTTVPNPAAPTGGVPTAAPPASAPAVAGQGVKAAVAGATGYYPLGTVLPGGRVDVRADAALVALRNGMAKLDANDPKNVPTIMALGVARAKRIEQLEKNYGGTQLIVD